MRTAVTGIVLKKVSQTKMAGMPNHTWGPLMNGSQVRRKTPMNGIEPKSQYFTEELLCSCQSTGVSVDQRGPTVRVEAAPGRFVGGDVDDRPGHRQSALDRRPVGGGADAVGGELGLVVDRRAAVDVEHRVDGGHDAGDVGHIG